jgi:hypothetical protein
VLLGHGLDGEPQHTILIDLQVEPADGFAERRAAIAMVDGNLPGSRRITLAGDWMRTVGGI